MIITKKKMHYGIGYHLFDIANYTLLLLLAVVTLYPILYVTFASISQPAQIASNRSILWHPLGFTMEAYALVLKNPNIASGYMNTLFIVAVGTTINLFMTSLLAYVLSRKNLLWNGILMGLVVFTMYFQGGLIPNFLLVKELGLRNSRFSVIIPMMINTMNLIIMRTSFQAIPDSLEESARIDGAGELRILFSVILPVSKALIAVIVLYYAVAHWNSWFYASLYLSDRAKYPLQVILREILIINDTSAMAMDSNPSSLAQLDVILKYATIVVATAPILVLYPFLQRYFIKGVMIGSLKG